METGKRVSCWIVRIVDRAAVATREQAPVQRVVDPYIADLIAKLQAEIRQERQFAAAGSARLAGRKGAPDRRDMEHAEAELTWSGSPLYFTEADFDAWERRALPPLKR